TKLLLNEATFAARSVQEYKNGFPRVSKMFVGKILRSSPMRGLGTYVRNPPSSGPPSEAR
ncbi:hypothetical protein, partial [Parageobacillus toebii]|uniref:hypothetical protein n=1 Tax=Parageobacillus toebii TaxID=153151 RepID=UPI002E1E3905|nr:hypothetical protein [Parageobacillus toebii]